MTVRFAISGNVVPWARAGRGRSGHSFTPAKQRNYMNVIKDACDQAMEGRPPMEGPLAMDVVAVYPWPKSTPKKRREAPDGAWKYTKPDADNIIKIVKDAIEGIAYVNDAQVSAEQARKLLGEKPRLIVSIRSLTGIEAPKT